MRILFIYYHHDPKWSVIHRSLLIAFRNLGHEVITCGRVNKMDSKTHLDIEFDCSQVTIEEILKKVKVKPDLLFFCWPNNHFWILDIEHSPIPTVLYAVDTHIPLIKAWMEGYSLLFDYVFSAQKNLNNAIWIPLAHDHQIHKNYQLKRDIDISFVGNLSFFQNPRRSIYLSILGLLFKLNLSQVYFDQMARVYSRSKIVLNIPVSNDLNARVFESLSSGSLLVTYRHQLGLCELFDDKKHLVEYSNLFDAIKKIAYYLKHDEIRVKIAKNGELEVKKHTYTKRVKEMLTKIKKDSFKKRSKTLNSSDCLKLANAYYLLGSKERTRLWLMKAVKQKNALAMKILLNLLEEFFVFLEAFLFQRKLILLTRKLYALKLLLWQLTHF